MVSLRGVILTYVAPALKTSAGFAFMGPDNVIVNNTVDTKTQNIWELVLSTAGMTMTGISSSARTSAVIRELVKTRSIFSEKTNIWPRLDV